MTRDPMWRLLAAADELTDPIRTVEPIWTRTRYRKRRLSSVHTVTHPSLLEQLAAAVVPGDGAQADDEPSARRIPDSRPPAVLDAIDRLTAITQAAAAWCVELGLTPRESVAGNIRQLVSAASTVDHGTLRALATDVQRWRDQAAAVTGWEHGAWAPHAPCPTCDRYALRVRLEQSTATCLECGTAWDESTIGLLARHIRAWTDRPA